MSKPRIGWYAEAAPGGTDYPPTQWYNVRIIGGPNRLNYTAYTSYNHRPGPNLWTVITEWGETFVAVESSVRNVSEYPINGCRFLGDPRTGFCTECEEDDQFFLEDDYVCGYCRTNVIDP